MGLVSRQAIFNSIYSVFGIAAGAINTVFILPHAFEEAPDDLGLVRVLLAQATIFGTIFGFGLYNIIIRENTNEKSNEYKKSILGFTLILSLVGFLLLWILIAIFPNLISLLINQEESPRLLLNISNLLILCFSLIFNQYFSSYIINEHKSPFVQFVKDPFLKTSYLILTVIYLFHPFSFELFLRLFTLMYATSTLLLALYSFKLGYSPNYIKNTINVKDLSSYSLYTILDKGAAIIANNLDLVMLGILTNLDNVGIYSIAFFIGAVILIPQKSIIPPTYPLVSNFLKKNQIQEIEKLYKQTSINQLIIGGVIFTLIWVNIDSLFQLMPSRFSEKWVVFYIGISKLFILSSGISGPIIVFSKYYKNNILFNVSLIIIAAIGNYILIPIYGMTGAAIATTITYALYNILKIWFVNRSFGIQPFEKSTIKVVLIIFFTVFLFSFVHLDLLPIISISIKSLAVGIILLGLLTVFKVKAEVIDAIWKILNSSNKRS